MADRISAFKSRPSVSFFFLNCDFAAKIVVNVSNVHKQFCFPLSVRFLSSLRIVPESEAKP